MSVPTLYTSSPDGCFAEASFCRPQCIILDRQCWGGAIYITDSPPPVQVAGTKGDPAMAAAGGRGGRGGAREGGNGRRGGRSGAVGRGGSRSASSLMKIDVVVVVRQQEQQEGSLELLAVLGLQ
ncbi:hypothetical protein Ndes2437B_g02035 [Nannochloris sp. 'desiccata']